MVDATPFLPGLSQVQGKGVVARFDGGRLSSEGGLLAFARTAVIMPQAQTTILLLHRRYHSDTPHIMDLAWSRCSDGKLANVDTGGNH
jgi:hypothetical protein